MWYKNRFLILLLELCLFLELINGQYQDIKRILSKCRRNDKNFDNCMKNALNKLNPFFYSGIPELGVASFDPHFAPLVVQKRGNFHANYNLRLTNVYERGWTASKVTKFRTDWKNDRIVYTQYFPEKSLNGDYDLDAYALGSNLNRQGVWNMTLYDYSQTTTITRLATSPSGSRPLDVKVVIDKIGDMQIHVSNILNGKSFLEVILDKIINATWRPGFVVIKPLINDLVSTAFTEIWTNSFGKFPFEDLIPA